MLATTFDISTIDLNYPYLMKNGCLPIDLIFAVEITYALSNMTFANSVRMAISNYIRVFSIDFRYEETLNIAVYDLFINDSRRRVSEGDFLLSGHLFATSMFPVVETGLGSLAQTSFGLAAITDGLLGKLVMAVLIDYGETRDGSIVRIKTYLGTNPSHVHSINCYDKLTMDFAPSCVESVFRVLSDAHPDKCNLIPEIVFRSFTRSR